MFCFDRVIELGAYWPCHFTRSQSCGCCGQASLRGEMRQSANCWVTSAAHLHLPAKLVVGHSIGFKSAGKRSKFQQNDGTTFCLCEQDQRPRSLIFLSSKCEPQRRYGSGSDTVRARSAEQVSPGEPLYLACVPMTAASAVRCSRIALSLIAAYPRKSPRTGAPS